MSPAAAATTPSASGAAGDLQVKASPRPGSRVALEVAIPGSRSQASYDAALQKLSRSVKLPGFRKGKVPRAVLLQQLGPCGCAPRPLRSWWIAPAVTPWPRKSWPPSAVLK